MLELREFSSLKRVGVLNMTQFSSLLEDSPVASIQSVYSIYLIHILIGGSEPFKKIPYPIFISSHGWKMNNIETKTTSIHVTTPSTAKCACTTSRPLEL